MYIVACLVIIYRIYSSIIVYMYDCGVVDLRNIVG